MWFCGGVLLMGEGVTGLLVTGVIGVTGVTGDWGDWVGRLLG